MFFIFLFSIKKIFLSFSIFPFFFFFSLFHFYCLSHIPSTCHTYTSLAFSLYRARKRVRVLIVFPLFLVFLYFLTSQHYTTHTTPHAFLWFFFWVFSVFPLAHTRTCAPATDRDLASGLSKSVCVNTRKAVKYARAGQSQGKLWWRLRQSGERPIEPSQSWFPPKFPSFSGKSG